MVEYHSRTDQILCIFAKGPFFTAVDTNILGLRLFRLLDNFPRNKDCSL